MEHRDLSVLQGYIDQYYNSHFLMHAVYNEWASANHIPATSLFVLGEINRQGECSQRSLNERLYYSKQTISSSLRRLEQDGYVTRVRSVKDLRNKVLALTPKGKETAETLLSRLRRAELAAFSNLSDEESSQGLHFFRTIAEALSSAIRSDIASAQ